MTADRQAAAQQVLAQQLAYAERGTSLAQAALAGARQCVEWAHYPRSDVVDPVRGTRFYYHAHPAAERAPGEHGHFHIFAPHAAQGGFFHLAGLSLDARGLPLRLFTTNQWVTGETWCDAATVLAALPGFAVETRGRLAPVARWLGAALALWAPQLDALVRERDALVAERARREPRDAVLADRRLHIVSQCAVDLPSTLASALPS